MQSVFFFVLRLCLLFTFQSDFIYYAINCFWICVVNVRNAKLRNYLNTKIRDSGWLTFTLRPCFRSRDKVNPGRSRFRPSIIPEPTARSPGRGLLIPHGYLHPGKKTALEDSKVGVNVGWVVISLISKKWMFIRVGRGKNYKKKHVRKLKKLFYMLIFF